jgi:hypothetical protein
MASSSSSSNDARDNDDEVRGEEETARRRPPGSRRRRNLYFRAIAGFARTTPARDNINDVLVARRPPPRIPHPPNVAFARGWERQSFLPRRDGERVTHDTPCRDVFVVVFAAVARRNSTPPAVTPADFAVSS